MKIQMRTITVEPFEGGLLVTFGEAPMQPRTAVVLHEFDAKELVLRINALLPKGPECNGTVVHDQFTLCPRCDR